MKYSIACCLTAMIALSNASLSADNPEDKALETEFSTSKNAATVKIINTNPIIMPVQTSVDMDGSSMEDSGRYGGPEEEDRYRP